ncbi:MAG: hypothetical protein ACRDPY_20115 [Streptosporangiaceae bacterium]
MTQVAVSAVGASRAGMASAVHNALRQFGQVLGVAVLGAIIDARRGPAGLHAAMWVSGLALLAAAAGGHPAAAGRPAAARCHGPCDRHHCPFCLIKGPRPQRLVSAVPSVARRTPPSKIRIQNGSWYHRQGRVLARVAGLQESQ